MKIDLSILLAQSLMTGIRFIYVDRENLGRKDFVG